MTHYRHMLWNNLALLAAWAAMAWPVGPLRSWSATW